MKTFKSIEEALNGLHDEIALDKLFRCNLSNVKLRLDEGTPEALIEGNWYKLHSLKETLDCFFQRSGQTMAANSRLSLREQIEVMNNYCFCTLPSYAKGKVLIRGEKVLALHSDRYSYINQEHILRTMLNTLEDCDVETSFVRGSYSHNFTEVVIRIDKEELLADYSVSAVKAGMPPIMSKGAYITFTMTTNDVGTSEVYITPKLHVAGQELRFDNAFQRKHRDISYGIAYNSISDGVKSLLVTAKDEATLIGKLMAIKVPDAEKTIGKCITHTKIKSVLPKAVDEFLEKVNYANITNAFQVYVVLHDFFKTGSAKSASKENLERCNRAMRKLVTANWAKLV